MKYFLDNLNRITGWDRNRWDDDDEKNNEKPWKKMEAPGALFDSAGNPRFKLRNKRIEEILEDQRTPEQLEDERSRMIESEIPYTIQEEIGMINEVIGYIVNALDTLGIQLTKRKYDNYREIVEEIIDKYPKYNPDTDSDQDKPWWAKN